MFFSGGKASHLRGIKELDPQEGTRKESGRDQERTGRGSGNNKEVTIKKSGKDQEGIRKRPEGIRKEARRNQEGIRRSGENQEETWRGSGKINVPPWAPLSIKMASLACPASELILHPTQLGWLWLGHALLSSTPCPFSKWETPQ